MKWTFRILAMIFVSTISLQALADDGADQQKLDTTADQAAACAQTKNLQQSLIYAEDDHVIMAQIEAYAQNDVKRQNSALHCVNDLGLAMQNADTTPTFSEKMKSRLLNIFSYISAMTIKNKDMRITDPVATIGIRG